VPAAPLSYGRATLTLQPRERRRPAGATPATWCSKAHAAPQFELEAPQVFLNPSYSFSAAHCCRFLPMLRITSIRYRAYLAITLDLGLVGKPLATKSPA
jgi:hypothetical protein